MSVKTDFNDCLNLIKTTKIRNFVKKALDMSDEEFWYKPCSSTGKYHPSENQRRGGIIIHSRKMVQIALSLFRFFDIKRQETKDILIAAVILHDIKKGGHPWKQYSSAHGLEASRWLLNEVLDEKEKQDPSIVFIADLVKKHMAIWNKPLPTPALKQNSVVTNKDICVLIVQLCDYFSSRKWCPFITNTFQEV